MTTANPQKQDLGIGLFMALGLRAVLLANEKKKDASNPWPAGTITMNQVPTEAVLWKLK